MKVNIRFYWLLILALLALIPAIHKLSHTIPAEWFVNLFKNSPINSVSGGIALSYWVIIILELSSGILFTLSLLFKEFKPGKTLKFGSYAFHLTLILFIILFFGSFLIENYENGFKDFIYFAVILFAYDRYFKE